MAEAIAKCIEIVYKCLQASYKPRMTNEELYEDYTSFGDDPYIVGDGKFSAWTYAKQKCDEICSK